MARRRSLLLVALLLGAAIGVPAAGAHDHRPPRTALRIDGQIQPGVLWSSGWSQDYGDYCSVMWSDGLPRVPRAIEHEPGEPIVIRIRKRQEPREADA